MERVKIVKINREEFRSMAEAIEYLEGEAPIGASVDIHVITDKMNYQNRTPSPAEAIQYLEDLNIF